MLTDSSTQARPRRVACGNAHSLLLLRAEGDQDAEEKTQILGWGNNRHNPLGLRRTQDKSDTSKTEKVTGISGVTLRVFEEPPKRLRAFEEGEATSKKKVHVNRHLVEVACGSNHSAILEALEPISAATAEQPILVKSRLLTCGNGANGQLGHGETSKDDDLLQPAEVKFPMVPGGQMVVQRVCCGADHTFAIVNIVRPFLTDVGRLFAWGLGSYGALGIGSWADCYTPTEVWFPDDDAEAQRRQTLIYQVAAGTKHSVALTTKGHVFTWGHGGHGRLGLGQAKVRGQNSYSAEFVPRQVSSLQGLKVTYIAAGEAHTAAVDQLGGLYTWGQGSYGRCGHGLGTDMPSPARVESLSGLSMSQVALGLMHSVTMSVKGQLYTWGKGPATGFDGVDVITTPRQVKLESRDPVYQISAGPLHTVVLMQTGDVLYFGSGTEGRLPYRNAFDGQQEDVASPTLLKPPDLKVKAWAQEKTKALRQSREASWWPSRLCCGSSSSAVLTGTGEVPPGGMAMENLWLWGTREISSVCDLSELIEMMEEDSESTIIDTNKDCWLPVPLKTGVRCRTVRMVAMGYEHCLIVTADSLMYSWGNGSKGQLGTGSMQAADTPQFITYPTDVLDVAAGEEHSACLIEGGECFTWGNAAGGRLGLGSCLTDGEQLSPKRVVIDVAELRVLRSVSCGSQHSALITQDGQLLTFGTGWFGRLGNGERDNEYVPKLVDMPSAVKEVHCATYHTCIVDSTDRLWVCGRDNSLCRDNQQHVLRPILFEPFNQPGEERCVRSLATVEQHTLVATYRLSNRDTMELWVWGKNASGQLGLPPTAAPVIDMPWRLQIPELQEMIEERGHVDFDIAQVATGLHHSMCLAITTDAKGNRQPLVYSWGSSGSGRLGFEQGTDDKLEMLQIREMHKGKVPERTQTTGPKHLRIYPPVKVASRWKKSQKDATHHVVAEKPESIDKDSAKWIDCQFKLFEELPDCKTKALQEQERKAEKTCKNQLDFICHLWDKPTSRSEVSEFTLRQLRKDIEVEYVRTLNALQMSGSGDGPQMEKPQWVKTDIDIKKKLLNFEELLWILQQQPVYMSRLSEILRKNSVQDTEHHIFRQMCKRIYHDLLEPRTLHLCKATLKLIMNSELEMGRGLSELFDPIKSHATFLITQLATHAAFVDGIALPILNPEDETSLVSTIIKYTMMKKDGETPRVGGTGEGDFHTVTGVFVTHLFEYQELAHNAEGGPPQGGEKNRYLNFQNELSGFQRCCATRGVNEREKDVHAGCIRNFIQNFVTQIFQDDRAKDFKMLLVSCFKSLRHSPSAKGLDSRDPKICTPLASLVLGNILASVLEALSTPAFSLVVLKIRKRIFENHRKTANKGESEFDRLDIAEVLLDRVLYNVQALAKVFQRSVHKQMFQVQFPTKMSQAPKEEPESRLICDDLREFTCEVLHQEMMELIKSSERSGGWMDEAQDPIAAELATDLYMSHFTLQNTHVSMSTLDLLQMANVLYRHRKDMIPSDDHEDKLAEVLDTVMARKQLEKPRKEDGVLVTEETSEYHQHGHVWLAQQHGEWHNFRLKARFLENMGGPENEPVFCHVSQAPIPNVLATEPQRSHGTVNLINKYTIPDKDKPAIDRMTLTDQDEPIEVFEHLEEIIQELSGNKKDNDDVKYQITGRTWIDLRTGFSKIQKALQQDIRDGNASSKMRGLVMDLEEGKKIIDFVMKARSPESDFMKYIDKSVQRRWVHYRYLEETSIHNDLILKSRESYNTELKEQVATLQQVLKVAMDCICPTRFTMAAAQRSEKISFLRLRRIKQRIRKTKPTPGQKIIDTMGSDENRDTAKLQELKDSIIPTQTFSLNQLESKGVVVRMHEKLPGKTRKHMSFTFQTDGEGFNVQIFLKTTLLKEFQISRQQIEDMEFANKTSASSYADDFVWMNGYRLRRLLTFIVVDNGV